MVEWQRTSRGAYRISSGSRGQTYETVRNGSDEQSRDDENEEVEGARGVARAKRGMNMSVVEK